MGNDLSDYAALVSKVDAKFAEIERRHPASIRCGEGCHTCCLPGLTVFGVERRALARWIRITPGKAAAIRRNATEAPHGGGRCALLDAAGRCLVYPVRPLVCRSHGVPLRVRIEPGSNPTDDVCPLNFEGVAIASLEGSDRIDLDTLNLLLGLVQRRFDPTDPGARFPLTADGLLGRSRSSER